MLVERIPERLRAANGPLLPAAVAKAFNMSAQSRVFRRALDTCVAAGTIHEHAGRLAAGPAPVRAPSDPTVSLVDYRATITQQAQQRREKLAGEITAFVRDADAYPVRLTMLKQKFGAKKALQDALRLVVERGAIHSTASAGPSALRGYWTNEAAWRAAVERSAQAAA